MTKAYSNAVKGFNYSMIAVGLLIVLSILAQFFNPTASGFNEMWNLILFLSAIVCLIIGIVYSFKGRKEPNSWKKIIGIALNAILLMLFILVLVLFFFDVYQILIDNENLQYKRLDK